ncbi:MAG: hypothetical protein ACLFVP_03150 [Candidatus Bathyarchaeia archaeon]
MVDFAVQFDFRFIDEALNYLENPMGNNISGLIGLDAAIGVYNHAVRFHNTKKSIRDFWEERLDRARW